MTKSVEKTEVLCIFFASVFSGKVCCFRLEVPYMVEEDQIMDYLSKLDIHRSGTRLASCKCAERASEHFKATLPIAFESL